MRSTWWKRRDFYVCAAISFVLPALWRREAGLQPTERWQDLHALSGNSCTWRVPSRPSIMCAYRRFPCCPIILFVFFQWSVKQNRPFLYISYSSPHWNRRKPWVDPTTLWQDCPISHKTRTVTSDLESPGIVAEKALWNGNVWAKISEVNLPVITRIVLRPLRHMRMNVWIVYVCRCTVPFG